MLGCPLVKAQTPKTFHPQSGGGATALPLLSPAPDGTTANENGSAALLPLSKTTGVVDFCVRMATDSLETGPKALMGVVLRDSNDKDIADIAVGEIGRGGRTHAKPAIDVSNFCGQATVSPDIAARTTSVDITVHITGVVTKRVGIDADDVIEGSRIVVRLP